MFLTKKNNNNIFSLQTQRLAEFFEGLNSSQVQSLMEILPCKNTYKGLTETKVLKNMISNPVGFSQPKNHS